MPPWVDDTVAITGGCGALGASLVERLHAAGARDMVIFDLHPPQGGAIGRYFAGDILDIEKMAEAFAGCSVVFHLAAISDARQCAADPIRCTQVNGFGTACVLEACRIASVKRLVYASTGHVYGVPLRLPADEEHAVQPMSLYAASKLAGEVWIRGYCVQFGISACIARFANIYGARVTSCTAIGRALNQVLLGEAIQLRSLAEVRDFLYIDDAVEALLRLGASLGNQADLRIVNVSSGVGVSLRDLVRELAGAAEASGMPRPEILPPPGPGDSQCPVMYLDNQRLQAITGWVPATTLRDGLARALAAAMALSS